MSSLISQMLKDISIDNPYIDEFKTTENKMVVRAKHIDYNPSKLRISTMTALSDLGTVLDTSILYEKMEIHRDINKYLDPESYGKLSVDDYPLIKTIKRSNTIYKGVADSKMTKKVKPIILGTVKKRDSFQNQLTFIIALDSEKSINVKLFKNGKFQMTGLRTDDDGYRALNIIINSIKGIDGICENNKLMRYKSLDIILINSDFEVGFKIRRDELFKIIGNHGLYVVYEPDIYPGVNSKYYYNKQTVGSPNDGICCCSSNCDGKGSGDGEGNCKKITIAIFQSGSIIITGSKTHEQMHLAYNFINRLISKHITIVKKIDIYIPKCIAEGNERVYYIKKEAIHNGHLMN